MSEGLDGNRDSLAWVSTTVGALGHLHCGQSPPSAEVNTEGRGTPYVSGPEQWDGYTVHQSKWTTAATRVAPAQSVFITVKGSGVGTLFPGVDAAIGRDIYAFEAHKSIDTRFVYYALRYSIQDVIAKARGDIPGLSKSHILDHPISVPGTSTQRKVASKIDELFSRIEEGERALERAQKLVERYRQCVLKAAVTGELTREWREQRKDKPESSEALLQRILKVRREVWEKAEMDKMKAKGQKPANDNWKQKYQEPSAPKIGLEESLPETWVQLSVEQATRGDRPIAYGVLQPGKDVPDGVPLVRVCDVADGAVDVTNLKSIAPEIASQFPRTQLRGGEVLLTLVGTIGRTAIVPPELAESNVARAVGVLSSLADISPEWLEVCLRYEKARQILTENAREVARKTLNLEQLREYAIPVPSLIEQREATSRLNEQLSKAIAVTQSLEQQIGYARALRQSILKSAFSGELVRQDHTEEPAAALLERIAGTHTTTTAKPKRGQKKNAA